MSKGLKKIDTILIIAIIIVCIVVMLNNFVKALQNKYYLKINSWNRPYVENLISKNNRLKGKLNKVAYKQGLGDWDLFLYYKNGTEEQMKFGDSDKNAQFLRKYIVENGYNDGKASLIKVAISFLTIVVAIIYEVSYVFVTKKRGRTKVR